MGKKGEEECQNGEDTKVLKLIEIFQKCGVMEEKITAHIVEGEGEILGEGSVIIVE